MLLKNVIRIVRAPVICMLFSLQAGIATGNVVNPAVEAAMGAYLAGKNTGLDNPKQTRAISVLINGNQTYVKCVPGDRECDAVSNGVLGRTDNGKIVFIPDFPTDGAQGCVDRNGNNTGVLINGHCLGD